MSNKKNPPKKQELQNGQNLKAVKEVAKVRKAVDDKEVTLKTRQAKLKFAMDVVFNEGILCNSDYNTLANAMSKRIALPVAKDKEEN